MKRLLLCYLVFFSVSAALLFSTKNYWSRGFSDFSCTYTAGTIVKSGNGAHLYDYDTQAEAQRPIRSIPLLYTHPPFETALHAPLALLSYKTAFMLWWAINHILFLSCWLVIAQTIPKTASILPASIVCFSIFMPVQFAFVNGQTSILVLLLLALALRSLLSDRDFTAGLLFSLAMVKPQLVLPAFAVLAIRRSRRFTFGFICGGVCELVLSIVMVGFAGVRSYLPFLHFFGTLPNSISGTHPEEMANIRGLLFRLHYDSGLALGILSVLVVVLAIVLTRRSKLEVQFAVAIAAGLMVSFHALPHELTLLILPFMIAVGQLIDRKIVGVKLIAATLISLGLIWSSALLLNPMITLVLMAAFCYTLTITEMDSEAHLDAHSLTADSD